MIASIKGNKYRFEVCCRDYAFWIKAMHIRSSRYSFINNLNSILSLLDVSGKQNLVAESQWFTADPRFSRECFHHAADALADPGFQSYIEDILDEDRLCGEWEHRARGSKR